MSEPTMPYSSKEPEGLIGSTKQSHALSRGTGHVAIYHTTDALLKTKRKAKSLLDRICGADTKDSEGQSAPSHDPCLAEVLDRAPIMIHEINESTFDLIEQIERVLFGDHHG